MTEQAREKIEPTKTKANLMDVGAGTLALEIPNGYIDSDGSLHYEIAVKEMTGVEEDLLGGKGPIQPRMNRIISNCMVQFGSLKPDQFQTAVAELTANDRMVALMGIRRISLGDFYDVQVPCPNQECKQASFFPINLSELEVIPMPDRTMRVRQDTLEKSGKVIDWHVMTAEDEAWLLKKTKKKEDMLTYAMMSRIDAIDGEPLDREKRKGEKALAILKALTIGERNEIRDLFKKHEGHVDIEVEFECPICEFEWKADMPIGQASFFFPSGG